MIKKHFERSKRAFICRTEKESMDFIKLLDRLGFITNFKKDTWNEFQGYTCYSIEGDGEVFICEYQKAIGWGYEVIEANKYI